VACDGDTGKRAFCGQFGGVSRSWVLFAATVLLVIAPPRWALADPDAEDSQGGQYQTKAEFLFDFAKFIDWPSRKFPADSPLVIGIVGADPFGGLLEEAAQDGHVNGRTVVVRHVEAMEEMRKCHIIFVCRSEASRLGPILSEVRGDNVLTVGESDNFISRGGMINFVMVGNRLRFEINNKEARHAGLKISAMLASEAVPSAHPTH
jgi:hypothetical protein